jgi:anti-sigma B factor antagonist
MATFMDFRVSTMKLGRRAYTITVGGELDLFTCTELQEELSLLPGHVTRALIDLSGVTFIDSTGIGLLVRFATRLRSRGGGVVLVVADGSIRKLLRENQLEHLFEFRSPNEEPARYIVGLSLLDSLSDAPLTRDAGSLGA